MLFHLHNASTLQFISRITVLLLISTTFSIGFEDDFHNAGISSSDNGAQLQTEDTNPGVAIDAAKQEHDMTTKALLDTDDQENSTEGVPLTKPESDQNLRADQADPVTEIAKDNSDTSDKPVPKIEITTCVDMNYCLNGGTCTVRSNGKMYCTCPEDFYGTRCQTKNICKTIIADSMTGDQICDSIGRTCYKNDRFFRCSCNEDEYFIFKPIDTQELSESETSTYQPPDASTLADILKPKPTQYSYEDLITNDDSEKHAAEPSETGHTSKSFIAECRNIDKCLGVRCRRMSEVCSKGECICNIKSGYMRDPKDGLCKLLDPCALPTPPDEAPICGQARCIATYDSELYKCICPIGYRAIKIGNHRNSTQCTTMTDLICLIPLLNKCQHICSIDQDSSSYKCSCFPGYKPGSKSGFDDHLCFFDEHIGNGIADYDIGEKDISKHNGRSATVEHVYKPYRRPIQSETKLDSSNDKIDYDKLNKPFHDEHFDDKEGDHENEHSKLKFEEVIIKREPRSSGGQDNMDPSRVDIDLNEEYGPVLSKLTAQERCNMYCEENKICVLEDGSVDSYKCICDRQGYVSVGDRCMQWCSAAEFSFRIRRLLDNTCYSGLCKPMTNKLRLNDIAKDESERLENLSSWRPTFECDCSNSPYLVQDETTKLCKLNFKAVIDICMPGNIGYEDCVVNKTAYCSVFHQHSLYWSMFAKLPVNEPPLGSTGKTSIQDKLYTCICSPEKKFLVDKPRNKAKCVNECDLLNNECNRFNRMCREATISPDVHTLDSLVRVLTEDPRMNIKRTGCECLPGFNVKPSELVVITLDDSLPSYGNPLIQNTNFETSPNLPNIVGNAEDIEHLRAKYININSRCLLDYDVVEFHASFKAPASFDPIWVNLTNARIINVLNPSGLNPSGTLFGNRMNSEGAGAKANSSSPTETIEHKTKSTRYDLFDDYLNDDTTLKIPKYMLVDIEELHKEVVLVSQCYSVIAILSPEAYQECIRYRYWIFQKLKNHFADWRRMMSDHLKETFDLMNGNIKVRVNNCEAKLIQPNVEGMKSDTRRFSRDGGELVRFDPIDQQALFDVDLNCFLTLHSARDESSPIPRKVLLEKQLVKYIFSKEKFGNEYYLMAPNTLIQRESFDQLAEHRKLFNPCKSNYNYCDNQTKCQMVDTVNFTCTCKYGYTPIGSRDIYLEDSRKEVCEDIDECLFDVCKELGDRATCVNEVGDYKCQCNINYVGDNKRYCVPVCQTIPCKHGKCRQVDSHHAYCECEEGYKESDCSVQDPSVALRKANMIICGSIFTSVLLLAVTLSVNLNSKLRKTKKKLKRLEAAYDNIRLAEFSQQAPFRPRLSKNSNSD